MTDVDLPDLAWRMLADYDARTPCRLFAEPFELTTDQAYALQTEVARLREQRGEKIIGYKVGCTSRFIQKQLGVQEPIFGRIFDTGCFCSGTRLSYSRFAKLAVEGELAVRLCKDLSGPAVSEDECREAIEVVFPVIEMHHYVLHNSSSHFLQLIASGGMHAGFVLAETETHHSGPENWVSSLSIRINEDELGAIDDAASLARPIESLRWLAGRLAQFQGQLYKGQVILTGSPLPLFPVYPGSRIFVEAPPLGASRVQIDP
jgi:2-keto-4-pentenoate hydratase